MAEQRTQRGGRWLPLATAGAVVLIAAGLTLGLTLTRNDEPPATHSAAPAGPADRLVRDGTRVVVSGEVRAVPGHPVRMCAPVPVAATGDVAYAPGREPAPGYCGEGVTVAGADLDALTARTVRGGVVWGWAEVEGRYAAGVVTVERQGPPDPAADRVPLPSQRPDCPPPAGGWRSGPGRPDRLQAYVAAHGEQYAGLWLSYPDGTGGPQVPVVGTVLDPAVAERALRAVHTGDLCVVRARNSAATLARVVARLSAGMADHHAYEAGPDPAGGSAYVRLLVVDAATQRWLDQADGRTGAVVAYPFVRPVR
jgi:hypothetical protein